MAKFRLLTFFIVTIIFLFSSVIINNPLLGAATPIARPLSNSSQQSDITNKPSVDFVQLGLCGEITADIETIKLSNEEHKVLLGTKKGFYIISNGTLLNYIATPNSVTDIAVLDDTNGNNQPEIAIAVWDTDFPNIRCYDSQTGNKLWQFLPTQEVFADNMMWIEQQTLTFDILALDINGDNIKDIIATSGYRIYGIDGKNGKQIWVYQTDNNVWKITATTDLNKDGFPEIAVGGQNGSLYLLSSTNGTLIWQKKIAEKYDVTNDQNNKKIATVDRSIWDIIPFDIDGSSQAIVSSEDGKVRLINLADGTHKWETSVIEYVSSIQNSYYSQKSDKPTSPRDQYFFNLRACLINDISGDGIKDVFVSSFMGDGRSALLTINGASGQVIWQNSGLSLSIVSEIALFPMEGKDVIVLPEGKTNFIDSLSVIDPVNGKTIRTIEIKTGPESTGGNVYRVKGTDTNAFILASNYGDLLMVSNTGDIQWDYPRVNDTQIETGEFCGDATEDLLIFSKINLYGKQIDNYTSRVIYVLDGATNQKVWVYEVPYEEYVATGGISSLQITPDINGDGKQDLAGFIQLPDWQVKGEEYGDDTIILVLSGSDGAVLLKQPVVQETYYGIWEQLYKDQTFPEKYLRQWFELQLEQQLAEIEKNLRQKNTSEADIQQNLSIEEQNRRLNFEQNDLPKMLNDLAKQMEKGEQGCRINKWIWSFGVMSFGKGVPAPVCFIIKTQNETYLMNPKGEVLLTWCFNPEQYNAPFSPETEIPTGVKLGVEGLQGQRQLVLNDLNKDGISDLATLNNNKIYIVTSKIDANDDLNFYPLNEIEIKEGLFNNRFWSENDIDGDGIREIGYLRSQENRPPVYTAVSPVTGKKLLEIEYNFNDSTLAIGSEDLNGDGYTDSLLFQKWTEGKEGPKINVISGRDKTIIWEYNVYRENYLFQIANIQSNIMPACPVSDISGDSISDIAVIQSLTYQSGAQIIIYDVTTKQELKRIVLEEINPAVHGDQRWHPGLLVKEIEDINGDGNKELAAIMPFGDTAYGKKWQLVIVDIYQDRVLADFQIFGSGLFNLNNENGFGMTGFSGEVYFLTLSQDLRIETPVDNTSQTSPINIKWNGTGEVALNQVFIDGTEVGRTNENELMVTVARGKHQLEVRSLDEYGRGIYQTVNFTVEKNSLPIVLLIILLAMFLLIALVPSVLSIIIRQRHRRERHG